jgi:hypothetical protein
MKFLQFQKAHHKNEAAFQRGCKLFDIEYCFTDDIHKISSFNPDFIWSPITWFEPTLFPNSKILYGPHFFVFPSKNHPSYSMNILYDMYSKHYFNTLSAWCKNVYSEFVESMNVPYACLPFGVDTDLFCPDTNIQKEIDCLVYFKHRHTDCLSKVVKNIQELNLSYKVIQYGSYNEQEYIETLKRVKCCIWVGSHESQGFALQECLSMNVPIFVWNATNMRDEYVNNVGQYTNYSQKLESTTVPYWDDRCGKIWNIHNDMKKEISEFITELDTYTPRSFVIERLSDQVCFANLLRTFNVVNTC